ncbi:MAG: hypothetical protein KF834_03380 [Burkholderiales bacterium]|nr:hypothetical protein [Burkholderiales bacterium]
MGKFYPQAAGRHSDDRMKTEKSPPVRREAARAAGQQRPARHARPEVSRRLLRRKTTGDFAMNCHADSRFRRPAAAILFSGLFLFARERRKRPARKHDNDDLSWCFQ